MAGFAVILYALGIVVAVAIVRLVTHRRQPAHLPARIAPVVAAARRRAVVAVAFAVVVFLAVAIAAVSLPALLGWPLAFAPLVAAAAGMLLYAATPPRDVVVSAGAARTAPLSRRSWSTAISQTWMRAWIAIAIVFVAIVVFCGITASVDDQGRSRVIRFASAVESSESSPYPGWFYGIPALSGLVLLVAATIIALRRISATAAFPHSEDADADSQWRRASASVVLKLGAGAVLFSLGGISLIGGGAMGNAVIGTSSVLWSVIAAVLQFGGLLFLVLSVIGVTLAALTAFTIGERVAQAPAGAR